MTLFEFRFSFHSGNDVVRVDVDSIRLKITL